MVCLATGSTSSLWHVSTALLKIQKHNPEVLLKATYLHFPFQEQMPGSMTLVLERSYFSFIPVESFSFKWLIYLIPWKAESVPSFQICLKTSAIGHLFIWLCIWKASDLCILMWCTSALSQCVWRLFRVCSDVGGCFFVFLFIFSSVSIPDSGNGNRYFLTRPLKLWMSMNI